MKFENFIFPISILSSVLSAPAISNADIIDYTLGLAHNAQIESQPFDIDNESLYHLGGITPIATLGTFNQFQLLEPQSGIAYSTSIRFSSTHRQFQHSADEESQQDDISVVSHLYQIGYGEQRDQWYSGVNLSVEQFGSDNELQEGDLWLLGFTAGSRIPLTGLGADAPLWLLSLNGEYGQYVFNDASLDELINHGIWYVTPAVHWTTNDFSLSAGLQMPLDLLKGGAEEEPNYRIRANFNHRF
jgi:hypothetical protein